MSIEDKDELDLSDMFEEDPTSATPEKDEKPRSTETAEPEKKDVELGLQLVWILGVELAEAIRSGELPATEIQKLYQSRKQAEGSSAQTRVEGVETREWIPTTIDLTWVYPAVNPTPIKVGEIEGEVGYPIKGTTPFRIKKFFLTLFPTNTKIAAELCNRAGDFWSQIDQELTRKHFHGDAVVLTLHIFLKEPYLIENVGENIWDRAKEGIITERQVGINCVPHTKQKPQIRVDCNKSPAKIAVTICS